MARLPRVTQPIFASSAANNGVFGSAQAGTKVTTDDLPTLMGLPAWQQGWLDAVIGASKFPPLEEFQALTYILTTQLAYVLQQGIPEYDAGTTYWAKNIVASPGTFQLYGSKTNSNTGNPLTDTTNWQFLIDLSSSSLFYTGGTSIGTANAQVLPSVLPNGFSLSTNGAQVAFTAGFTNTGSTTFNIVSTGATIVKKLSGGSLVNLTGGEITATNTIFLSVNTASSCLVLTSAPALGTVAPLNLDTTNFTSSSGNLAFGTLPVLPSTTTGTTQLGTDSSTKIATTAQVAAAIALIPAGSTSVAGLLGLATAAIALAGTDTTVALTSGAVAANSSLGTNGYYKFPGGLILQWGTDSGGGNPRTVNFPISFATACYGVVATSQNGNNDSLQAVNSVTTGNFQIIQGFSAAAITFFALGK